MYIHPSLVCSDLNWPLLPNCFPTHLNSTFLLRCWEKSKPGCHLKRWSLLCCQSFDCELYAGFCLSRSTVHFVLRLFRFWICHLHAWLRTLCVHWDFQDFQSQALTFPGVLLRFKHPSIRILFHCPLRGCGSCYYLIFVNAGNSAESVSQNHCFYTLLKFQQEEFPFKAIWFCVDQAFCSKAHHCLVFFKQNPPCSPSGLEKWAL